MPRPAAESTAGPPSGTLGQVAIETSSDAFFGGALLLEQPRRGLRFGTDSLLLALEAATRRADRVVDLGAGVGGVGLAVALRRPSARVTLVELVPTLATLAERNARANGLAERVDVRLGDVRQHRSLLEPGCAELVVTNPPYYPVGSGRLSPDPMRAAAHHEVAGTLGDFLAAARYALRPGGELLIVYKPERLADLLVGMRGADLSVAEVCPVYPRSPSTLDAARGPDSAGTSPGAAANGADAIALLVSARAGGGPPLRLAAPRYADALGATSDRPTSPATP